MMFGADLFGTCSSGSPFPPPVAPFPFPAPSAPPSDLCDVSVGKVSDATAGIVNTGRGVVPALGSGIVNTGRGIVSPGGVQHFLTGSFGGLDDVFFADL